MENIYNFVYYKKKGRQICYEKRFQVGVQFEKGIWESKKKEVTITFWLIKFKYHWPWKAYTRLLYYN